MRSQEREIRRKKEYFTRLEEQRLLKIQEEEEAKKKEGGYLMFLSISLTLCRYPSFLMSKLLGGRRGGAQTKGRSRASCETGGNGGEATAGRDCSGGEGEAREGRGVTSQA